MIGILLHTLKQNKESINSSTTATAVNIQLHFLPCFVENIIFAVADLYSVAKINDTHTHTPLYHKYCPGWHTYFVITIFSGYIIFH